jgi:hypothetical protein
VLALKLVHVGLAFMLVAGLIGRWLLLRQASRATDVGIAYGLSEAAAPFERAVIWGSMAIVPAGFLTAWAQGYPWLGLTAGWMLVARRTGTGTPRLRAAFDDRAVALARYYEAAVVAIIVALMVAKPF